MKGKYSGLTNTEYMRLYRVKNRERLNAISRKSARRQRLLHREEINRREREYRKRTKADRLKYQRQYMQTWALNAKTKVLTYYGNGKLACVKCGFDNLKALSIDHIAENGNEHRREMGVSSGWAFYRWLMRDNFPKGYQTLCMNCQFIKRA